MITIYYHFEIRLLPEILNYNNTGGIFKRVGMTAVNDYGYILSGSIIAHIISRKRINTTDIFLFLVITYGILLTGSRSAAFFLISGLIILLITSKG